MKKVDLQTQEEKTRFAIRAAKKFKSNSQCYTYTDSDIESGEYFAVRWGLDGDCVVVFEVGHDEPINYINLVNNNTGE